jgi:hypothetical protein
MVQFPRMIRIAAPSALVALALASCAPSLGPPPPSAPPPAPIANAQFSAADFAWSQRPGTNIIAGRTAYRQGVVRFTCAGGSVVLTPETAWSRRRMTALYGSAERAALPADEVRARTPNAPPGDAAPFIKRTTCDEADQFAFANLADGAWFAITIVRPVNVTNGQSVALMRRVVVRGGRTTPLVM